MKVLIVDQMHHSVGPLFQEAGFEPHYCPDISKEEIFQLISGYEGLVVRSKIRVDKQLLDEANNLKFVARAGAGIDNIDYGYLTEKGVILVNAPEGNRDAVGEHAVGMLLSLIHNIDKANEEVKQGMWEREGNRGWELKGKTVGIYGYGFMGTAFAEKLQGFGVKILAFDKYKSDVKEHYVEQVGLDQFFGEVEVLSIHVPLTSETKYLFDLQYLSNFKRLKVIINTSRGEILHLSAVQELLKSGKLLAAGLDVLENEKLHTLNDEERDVFDELAAMPNVIMTPHVAGWTFESYQKINQVMVEKLQSYNLGVEAPVNCK